MTRLRLASGNYRLWAVVVAVIVLSTVGAVNAFAVHPASRADYLAWRQPLADTIEHLSLVDQALRTADDAVRAAAAASIINAMRTQIVTDIADAEAVFAQLGDLTVLQDDQVLALQQLDQATRLNPFRYYRMAAYNLGIGPMGNIYYQGMPGVITQTWMDMQTASGTASMMWQALSALDRSFGVEPIR